MKKLILIPICLFAFTTQGLAEQPKGTIVNLSAQASMEVPNDEVVIRFRVEAQGKKIDVLRNNVNRTSVAISKRLKGEPSVKLKTTNRQVNPIWVNGNYPRKRDGWSVVQTGTITSTNLDKVPDWLEAIEDAGAKLQSLSFRISNEVRRETQEKLRIQAIAKFRKKAELVTKALDGKSFVITHLNTGSSYSPQPMYRGEMAMMSKSMVAGDAAPSLSSGDSRISASVNGGIEVEKITFKVK